MKRYVLSVTKAKETSLAGLEVSNLCYLRNAGFKIPKTYVCPFNTYEDYFSGNTSVLADLETELEKLLQEDRNYSIRPSASLTGGRDYSFAGQFESYLNVSSLEQVIKAIQNIWESCRGDRVTAYLNRIGKSIQDFRIAVIIQEMIAPQLSGVVFTKSPVTGMDEIIIESVPGLGDSLAQGRVTPDRWVYKWGNWIQRPLGKETDLPVVSQVVLQAKRIANKYGKPVDLEWAYDGKKLFWLRLREIRTLKGVNIYSNKISKEFMPGIIKPLIWSINTPVMTTSWEQLFIELVGKAAEDIDITDLAKSFCYRSYFNMRVIGDIFELLGMPRESSEIIMGVEVPGGERPKFKPSLRTFKYVPRMLQFAVRKSLYSKKIESFLVTQKWKYDYYASIKIERLSERETLHFIEQLFQANTEASYFVIISELLAGFYNKLLKRRLAKRGLDIQSISFTRERKLLRDINPSYHLSWLHDKYDELSEEAKLKIKVMNYEKLSKSSELDDFRSKVERFRLRFGHLGESGDDFSQAPWKETPELVLKMIIDYQRPESKQSDKTEADALSKGFARGAFLRYIYDKVVKYRVYRERVNFVYTYGYGLFRPYFMHLAKLFKEKSYMEEEPDIFYLTFDEVKDIVKSGVMTEECKVNLVRRKQEVVEYKDIDPPGLIIGDPPPALLIKDQASNRLKGLAASKGYREGRIKVIRGSEDFAKAEDGDIVIIPYSDASWIPVFSKAKAIVSESGGMLSHCSIIAREYNIPAVASVPDALKLEDGTRVVVDGYGGEVLIMK